MTEAEIYALWWLGFGGPNHYRSIDEAMTDWAYSEERLIFWQLVALSEGMYRG